MRAEEIARLLGARRSGAGWIARCPAHEDRTPSLSIGVSSSGKLLLHCFAGCAFADIIAALPEGANMAHEFEQSRRRSSGRVERVRAAQLIWRNGRSIAGTLAERYLAARAVEAPREADLRFVPLLAHPRGAFAPAMIGAMRTPLGEITGIHRTWLAEDGDGKAPLEPPRAMLGVAKGSAISLRRSEGAALVAEGVETALSVAPFLPNAAIYAALSAGLMADFPLRFAGAHLIIAADGDPAGREAAHRLAIRAQASGRRVQMLQAPDGADWNDIAMREARQGMREAQAAKRQAREEIRQAKEARHDAA